MLARPQRAISRCRVRRAIICGKEGPMYCLVPTQREHFFRCNTGLSANTLGTDTCETFSKLLAILVCRPMLHRSCRAATRQPCRTSRELACPVFRLPLNHINSIATSGGGYRAAMFGAGVMMGLDGRNQTSVSAGTGGLLQAIDHLSGLSGGSWLVTSLAQAKFVFPLTWL